jgi:tetratricopeptide (TPR) repeat protein
MLARRHVRRSLVVAAALSLFAADSPAIAAQADSVATESAPAGAASEQATVQQLIERGALQEAVQRAEGERGNVESTYLAAQAFIKMENSARANEEYARLREEGDPSWKAIGESGAALLAGNMTEAMQAATRAVDANADNPYAHYQVGAVASRQSNFQRASQAFTRSIELKPDLAYAHYYAGLAAQRLKQIPKMSEHFETFLRLAPEAPERAAVAAVLRTLRP